ncbi:MAG: hypothetical protein P9L94_14825 [Candidatus Hinthialibacter antarcticus]|nr:hypothetical protein [Candidatus Hinthialibacter antarcticus]
MSWTLLTLYLCALSVTTVHTHQHYAEPSHAGIEIEAPECGSCAVDVTNHACSICNLAQAFHFDLAAPVAIVDGNSDAPTLPSTGGLPDQSHLHLCNPRAPPAVS